MSFKVLDYVFLFHMRSLGNTEVLKEIKTILKTSKIDILSGLKNCCDFLKANISYFDWVGFYFADFQFSQLYISITRSHKFSKILFFDPFSDDVVVI